MAFGTITSDMENLAVNQISSRSFYNTFGDVTLSEALRNPLAQQSTKVRRAIKDAYQLSIQNTNQTGLNDSYLTSVDDPNDTSGSTATANENDDIAGYDEESIFVIVNGVLTIKTFLTKTTDPE